MQVFARLHQGLRMPPVGRLYPWRIFSKCLVSQLTRRCVLYQQDTLLIYCFISTLYPDKARPRRPFPEEKKPAYSGGASRIAERSMCVRTI